MASRLLDRKHTTLLTTGKVDTGNVLSRSAWLSPRATEFHATGTAAAPRGVNGDLTIYPQSGYITAVLCKRRYPLALNAAGYIGARLPAQ